MAEAPKAGPGWYPNSVAGQEQWWDGTSWTNNTRQRYVGIGASGPPETIAARRAYWTEWSRQGSLIFGIVLILLSVPVGIMAIFGVVALSPGAVIPVLIWALIAGCAALMFVNYYVRGKQMAALRAQDAASLAQAVTPE